MPSIESHLLLASAMSVNVVQQEVSDHLPIVVDMAFKPHTTPPPRHNVFARFIFGAHSSLSVGWKLHTPLSV